MRKSPPVKLDIVTPTRNRLSFLKENMESVRMSRTAPLDLAITQIIHDCGSDDGTADWIEEEKHQRGDFLLVRSSEKVHPGEARNIALQQGTGDFIMPLDDDDLLLQRTAYHFVSTLQDNDARWATSDYIKIDSEGRYLPGEDYHGWVFDSADDMLRAIFSGQHYIQGNVCFRRDLFEKVGGYASALKTAEDLELYVRFLLEAGLPKYVPATSHLHRVHNGNISRNVDKDRYNRDMETIYRLHEPRLRAKNIGLVLIP
jgi:glycosyltransferase involved in cell wall biosynthesis